MNTIELSNTSVPQPIKTGAIVHGQFKSDSIVHTFILTHVTAVVDANKTQFFVLVNLANGRMRPEGFRVYADDEYTLTSGNLATLTYNLQAVRWTNSAHIVIGARSEES